ncbi:MAG TPA: ABC transporter substrate-binding protein [Pseudonocardiaceae bacterium]|jgi:osmoprotectant transport system substrate-binding protein|nr:ABC transporter substrate-binding protein [Pseudonocardiaceae bacterium]
MKRIVALVAAILMAAVVTACGSSDPLGGGGEQGGPVVVGSADFAESELLMEIYAAALRQAGVQVQTRPRLGTREITNRALADGSITVMPEYSGNLLQSFDPDATVTAPDAVYAALQQALPDGLEVLEQSQAEDSDVLVVTQQTSQSLGLTSMDQLGPVCGQLTLGAAGEWPGRWQDKIAEVYGCSFREIKTTDAGGPVTLEALRSGQVQVVNLFTTSPDIAANGWVELADPRNMYPAQRILPLVRSGTLSPAGVNALNQVSAKLTTEELTELNRRILEERAVPADLAKQFVG